MGRCNEATEQANTPVPAGVVLAITQSSVNTEDSVLRRTFGNRYTRLPHFSWLPHEATSCFRLAAFIREKSSNADG